MVHKHKLPVLSPVLATVCDPQTSRGSLRRAAYLWIPHVCLALKYCSRIIFQSSFCLPDAGSFAYLPHLVCTSSWNCRDTADSWHGCPQACWLPHQAVTLSQNRRSLVSPTEVHPLCVLRQCYCFANAWPPCSHLLLTPHSCFSHPVRHHAFHL